MIDFNELQYKYDLVTSKEWYSIKQRMLENILQLSNSDISPLIIQGMLKVINDTDKWEDEYNREKLKNQ